MSSSLELFTIRGIRIGINWSWLVIFALIVWTWTTAVFPSENPGLSDGTYLAMAVIGAVLFFASLLAHELGHAFQAQHEGMRIEGITLWLFGGVAKFRGMFETAGAEFRIAIAGPLVSLALGLAFALIAWAADLPVAVDGVAAWLGYLNLMLLVFNLLPALPLDGGRVLRAALWRARGDFAWATRVAASIGRGFGYLMLAGGIVLFIFESSFSGAWLAFIGWFLLGAATAEQRYLAAREAFGGLRVRDLMARDPVTVEAGLTLGRFMDEVVWSRRHTTYPVVENGSAVGLLPFRRVAAVPRGEWDLRHVRDCMLPLDTVPVLDPGDELVEAASALAEGTAGRALVLEDGRLVGLLSLTDIARALEVGGPKRRAAT
ncbi:MAG: site-2 protease family protein [Thermoleophilia bacterium]|nr:site-2 protease family protein [Thermoleophilia bacterium]